MLLLKRLKLIVNKVLHYYLIKCLIFKIHKYKDGSEVVKLETFINLTKVSNDKNI
jgi:hypothetical protein